MLLLFDEEHKEHLHFLGLVSPDVVKELCRITMQFLREGVNAKLYSSAAGKLGVERELIENGVNGLMFLLAESSRLSLNDIDFNDSLMTLGLAEPLRNELLSVYNENKAEIRKILSEMTVSLNQYHDLSWRLNVKLASRSLRGQVSPSILMKLHTKKGETTSAELLECDIPNLINLTESLDQALQESKSQYTRRILRNIK